MNRSDLRTRVRTLTNIFSTALLSDAQINTILEEIHYEVCGSSQWPFLQDSTTLSVVAGDSTYTLPADTREVLLVSSKDLTTIPRQLNAISTFDADTIPDDYQSSWPQFYTVEGLTLTLYPEPFTNETLTVRYQKPAEAFDGDTDVPPFDAEFHPVYAYAAAARVLAERGAPQTKVKTMVDLASVYAERMRRFYLTSADHATVSMGKRRWRR